jgi:sarcosine oxidase subunit beta
MFLNSTGKSMSVFKADVIVIGGGIVGSSIAYRIAEKKHSVILLEKGRVGEEASGRNGGGVRQQDRHPAEIPLAMEAIEIWARMKDELDWDVGYRRGGNLHYAHSQEKMDLLQERFERETRLGLKVEMLSSEDARRITPSLSEGIELFGAKYCPSDGSANPLLATKAIARMARERGVHIQEHAPVAHFNADRGKVTAALTAKDVYEGDVFVNAAGPWAKGLCNRIGLDVPITVQGESKIITEPLSPMIEPFVQSDMFYFRQALEGNFHVAGELTKRPVDVFEKDVDFETFIDVSRWLPVFFPFFRHINVIRCFTGLIHYTPDRIPILDKAPGFENLFLAAGFSGHGFCLGPIVGRLMAEWVVDGASSIDLKAFRWNRFAQSSDALSGR